MEFITFLNEIRPMSPELINHLSGIVKTVTLHKNEYLVKARKVCKNVYFVKEGLLRSFKLEDGKEVSNWFTKENDVVAVESFLHQTPSEESIQALEACTLQYITYSQLQDIYPRFIEFNIHGRILAERNALLSAERVDMLKHPEPLERYLFLLNKDQEFIKRVDNKHIASHLEISVRKLSQLKKMAKQTLTGNIKQS
jgi:CRP-like cAMP-binding protein